jgi:hemerythrin
MPLVNWSQELVVDVKEIDEQHKKLVTMLNGFHDAMKVGQVTDFRKGFGDGRMSLTLEVMNFLKDWLTGHILGVDKKYAPFFAAKGLK